MSPNDCYFIFNKILPLSSSISSDSESLFDADVKNSEKHSEDQWEIIERTLYQEPGSQVTDPELFKECKLWRNMFPHFRVTGTKIDLKGGDPETDQSCQFNINKLNEKRESIKKKVVGELVERLISKFGSNKELESKKSSVQITEIADANDDDDDDVDGDDDSEDEYQKIITASLGEEKMVSKMEERNITSAFGEKVHRDVSAKNVNPSINTEEESYFERGKPKMRIIDNVKSPVKEAEKGLLESLNSRDKVKDYRNLPKLQEYCIKSGFMEKNDLKLRSYEKQGTERSKPKAKVPPSDSITSLYKPFKMTTKIDKKYENLLGQIMERRQKEPDRYKHCRTSSSGIEMKNCEESLENLRIGSGFNFRKSLPKINKFNNNWLDLGNARACYALEDVPLSGKNRTKKKVSEEVDFFEEDGSETDIDEFIENIRREMSFDYKGKPRKVEGIDIRKKKFNRDSEKAVRSVTSSSCGNLTKKEKKETKKPMKSGQDKKSLNKPNFNNRGKLLNPNSRITNVNGSKNSLLPPIETGIICTELTGRPKIGPKILPKRC